MNTSGDEDFEDVDEIGANGLVVNPNGHYERFDEIDLDQAEEEEKEEKEKEEEEEDELSLVLN